MKIRAWFTILTVIGPLFLLGCSTPQPAPVAVPLPEWFTVPPGLHDPNRAFGRACQLGTSCLALDPRPFEVCLLGTTKRCGDKIQESLLVDKPEVERRP